MAEIKTGGPAFPRSAAEHSQGGHYEQDGMDLRDYFAAKALVGIGAWMPIPETGMPSLNNPETLKARAEFAYRQADAMIAAREGGAS